MTKKDFVVIAEVLYGLIQKRAHCFDNEDDQKAIIRHFSIGLAATNARFDMMRFEDAALNGKFRHTAGHRQ